MTNYRHAPNVVSSASLQAMFYPKMRPAENAAFALLSRIPNELILFDCSKFCEQSNP